MKRVLAITMAAIMLMTGCSGSDLEEYRQALIETESYETGVVTSDMDIDLIFNETDLSFEEIRELSYFEEIVTSTKVTYDGTGNEVKSIIDGYFNFGGLGFDMIYYVWGDDMLIKLPIMDKYLDIDMTTEQTRSEADSTQAAAVERMIATWNAVLNDEDVLSGKKAYVMTDKGQIKTTTYTLNINNEQFDVMKTAMLEILEDEGFIEAFLADGNYFSDYEVSTEEVQAYMTGLVENLELETFVGNAYVDFDGRLVRQVIEAELRNPEALPGEVATMKISYESTYDQLGEALELVLPQVSDEDMLNIEEGESLEDFFPEGLFE